LLHESAFKPLPSFAVCDVQITLPMRASALNSAAQDAAHSAATHGSSQAKLVTWNCARPRAHSTSPLACSLLRSGWQQAQRGHCRHGLAVQAKQRKADAGGRDSNALDFAAARPGVADARDTGFVEDEYVRAVSGMQTKALNRGLALGPAHACLGRVCYSSARKYAPLCVYAFYALKTVQKVR